MARVVLLTGPFLTHDAFISTLASRVPVTAAVRETRFRPSSSFAARAFARARAAGSPSRIFNDARSWIATRARDRALQPAAAPPPVQTHDVHDMNSDEGIALVRSLKPDVIAVCGTGLLQPAVFEAAARGAVNLHLGLSPRYRGSHCVFWPLYNREPEWVGLTVHYLDAGIDAGSILAQRRPVLEPDDDVESLVAKSLRLGYETMAQVVERLSAGPLEGVRQNLAEGRCYNSRELTPEKREELKARLAGGYLRDWVRGLDGRVPPVPLINV